MPEPSSIPGYTYGASTATRSTVTAADFELMKKTGVRLVVVESFYPSAMARFVADNGRARLVAAPSNVGATPAIKTYFDLVDAVIAALKGG